MAKSKYGIIRKNKKGVIKGYVDMGLDYFCYDELDVIDDYIDLGYHISDVKYIMIGGESVEYLYKYRSELGEKIEERVTEIDHPTMMMVSELKVK